MEADIVETLRDPPLCWTRFFTETWKPFVTHRCVGCAVYRDVTSVTFAAVVGHERAVGHDALVGPDAPAAEPS